MAQPWKPTPKTLSPEDKTFVRLVNSGMPRIEAFRRAYPNHANVVLEAVAETEEEKKVANGRLTKSAQDKVQAKYMQRVLAHYQEKMDEFAVNGITVANDLLLNGRSEKVRADLAIEAIRHKVGTPVQKMAVQSQQEVIITFGKPHERDVADVPEADILDEE